MPVQVNVRLDERLLGEIDVIARVLHISRTEWLRTTIARAVKDETLNLKEATVLEFARGHITEDELRQMLGIDAEDVEYIVRSITKGKTDIDALVEQGRL